MKVQEQDVNLRFADMANPHSWFMTADNLHQQAIRLYKHRGQSILTHIDYQRDTTKRWDGTNKSVFLLGGFALENAIKAFLVYENPEWISNGKLSRNLKSHSLTKLQQQSSLVPFKKQYLWTLQRFEEGLESWARYPCSLTVETTMDENPMPANLWAAYLRVMRAYGRRLKELLSREWHGPHGFYGRWRIQGEYLAED